MGERMRTRTVAPSIAVFLLAAIQSGGVRAEVRVQGAARDVRVEAQDATVADILAALAQRFALRYRGSTGTRGVTATFEGSLRHVVGRVLDGYNYVIQARDDGLEVIVLSTTSPNAVVQPTIAPQTHPSKSTRRNE
jgi:hypothetical protein